jgi:hypothetical protein
MKQFDDIFRKKVSEAFSNYNADLLTDKGWQSFMAARKGKSRLNWIVPLWAKAATVALIVGLSAFITFHTLRLHPDVEMLTGAGTTGVNENVVTDIPDPINTVTLNQPTETIEIKQEGVHLTMSGSNTTDLKSHEVSLVESNEHSLGVPSPETGDLRSETTVWKIQPAKDSPFSIDLLNTLSEQELIKLPGKDKADLEIPEPETHHKKTRMMAGLSGLLAGSAEGTTGAQGVALGFYVDRRITERISFRPGIALAMNTVGLNGNSGVGQEFAYNVPLYDGNNGTLDYYEGRLSMLAMEIPLNFVFSILERKRSGLYLAAGASTMIYLNQQFEGDFVNEYTQNEFNSATGQFTSGTRSSTVTLSNDYGAFSRTDLLGLANFSAGYSLPYGKTGTLFIEPFVQIPLNDLTSLNLRVRYGGFSMKLRFGDNSGSEK